MSLHESTTRALHRIALDKQVKGRVPGLYAGVVRGGGFVWHEGLGAADVSVPQIAPTAEDQFMVASNTKTFTAVGAICGTLTSAAPRPSCQTNPPPRTTPA